MSELTAAQLFARGATSAPHIRMGQKLRSDVEKTGGTMPQPLLNLLTSADVLRASPSRPDPAQPILDAAMGNGFDESALTRLVEAAAAQQSFNDYRDALTARAAPLIAHQFTRELLNGAADQIIDSFRPRFSAAADVIKESLGTLAGLGADFGAFVDTATPEQLAAFQVLRPAADTINEIVNVVARSFGIQDVGRFPTLRRPKVYGVSRLSDTAIFTNPPGVHPYRRSSFEPRGLHFSPWLSRDLRLNSIAEAQALVDTWEDSAVS